MSPGATRGQPSATATVRRMIAGPAPHAILLTGPPAVGKTTLALDLAAGLLCSAADPELRPCGTCRACRTVASGNHPDLHRLAPDGPGGQVRLGDPRHPEPGSVRHLAGELALLPVEGGARVAIVEAAQRLNEDAQNALLKTLEEPPPGVTIVLCADEEDALLPTVRSRCVRVRLGPVSGRAIEGLLGERGLADPPTAARLARLAEGRPGLALAYAVAPGAVRRREKLARWLLDLLHADRRARLVAVRDLLPEAAAMADELSAARDRLAGEAAGAVLVAARAVTGPDDAGSADVPVQEPGEGGRGRISPAERRRAAAALLEVWSAVSRDLAVAALGGRRELRDPALLEELVAAADGMAPEAPARFLGRLARTSELLEQNANPELALDVLALSWPRVAA